MKRFFLIMFFVLAAGFAFGLWQLFQLRFELGDVYPEYSSLRSDPLGTMALYESLSKMPGLSVRRDFSASNQLPDRKNTTYLHLAAKTSDWKWLPDELIKQIEGFTARGGRLAITFFPETTQPFRLFDSSDEEWNRSAKKKKSKTGPAKPGRKRDKSKSEEGGASLKERWGLEFGWVPLAEGENGSYQPALVRNQSDLALPARLEWHSAIVFTNRTSSWQTIYTRGTNAVVIERRFGSGTIVMATDSYFLSNEALLKDRHADLLAWLVGPATQVMFDEAHLGLLETSGVAMLLRKYRLGGLLAGLVVLAGLFVWKNSLSFVPAYSEQTPSDHVAGKEAAAGFVNLLRRNLAPRDLLKICFEQWQKSHEPGSRPSPAKLAQAQSILTAEESRPPSQRDPVRAYQEISQILKSRH